MARPVPGHCRHPLGAESQLKGGLALEMPPGHLDTRLQAHGRPVQERGVLSAGDGPTRSPLWSRIPRGGSGGTWGACDSSRRPLGGLPAQTQTSPRPHHFLLALTTTSGKKPSDARTPDGVPTPPGHGERGGSGRHPERPAHHPSQARPGAVVPPKPPADLELDAHAHGLARCGPDREPVPLSPVNWL